MRLAERGFVCRPGWHSLVVPVLLSLGSLCGSAIHASKTFAAEDCTLAQLQSTIPDERARAAIAAGVLLRRDLSPRIVHMLRDPDENVRASSAVALGELGQASLDSLVAALSDWSPRVRAEVAIALGKIARREARGPLSRGLRDSSSDVRTKSAKALGGFEDSLAVTALIRGLGDWDAGVRGACVTSLAALQAYEARGSVMRLLADGSPEVRAIACVAIAQLRASGARVALEFRLLEWEAPVRAAAAEALGILADSSAAPALRRALEDANAQVRAAAVVSLAKIDDTSAVPAIINLSRDWSPSVRKSVAVALGAFANRADTRETLIQLGRDAWPPARVEAMRSLRWCSGESACTAALAGIGDWDGAVRAVAISTLGHLRCQAASAKVLNSLRYDPDPQVRIAVPTALASIRGRDALPDLRRALYDWNRGVGERVRAVVDSLSTTSLR